MFDRILVCADRSECSLKAARVALDIAEKYGSRVTVVNVFRQPVMVEPTQMAVDVLESAAAEAHERVRKQIAGIVEQARNRVEFRGEEGRPVETILQVADQVRADLIVMGSRGHGEIRLRLLGSTTDGVAHHAHCPVLIVR